MHLQDCKNSAQTPAARLASNETPFGDTKTTISTQTSGGPGSFGGTPEKVGQGLIEGSYSQAAGEASIFSLLTPQAADNDNTKDASLAGFKLNAQTLFAFGVSTALSNR